MESKNELEKLIAKYNDYYIWNNTDKHSFDIIEEDLNRLEKQDKAIEIIKRYAVNDGWSNGWVIKFWEMNSKELDLLKEVFKNGESKFSK